LDVGYYVGMVAEEGTCSEEEVVKILVSAMIGGRVYEEVHRFEFIFVNPGVSGVW